MTAMTISMWNLLPLDQLLDLIPDPDLRFHLGKRISDRLSEAEDLEQQVERLEEDAEDCDRLQNEIDDQQTEIDERNDYIKALHALLAEITGNEYRTKAIIIAAIEEFRREVKEPT